MRPVWPDQRKERYRFAGGTIPVISATDLTVFKTVFDRDQDWVDIRAMLRGGTVDVAAARRWVEHLAGPSAADKLAAAAVSSTGP